MNRSQLAKYHILKKQWADARTARKMPADQDALDTLQKRTIGRACSSTTFSQLDLDKMVAAFKAEIEPDNFNAQMAQQEQPFVRNQALTARVIAAGRAFIEGANADTQEWKIIRYVEAIQRNMSYPVRWPISDETQLRKIMGIMERKAASVAKVPAAPATPSITPPLAVVHTEEAPLF